MFESQKIFEKKLEDEERDLRLHQNQLLESAQVGDKPFDKEFYDTADLPLALEQANHVVIILGEHIGDATLSVPVITSLASYFELNSIEGKKVTVISSHKDLFNSFTEKYPQINLIGKDESFHFDPAENLFCINLNRKFRNYNSLGIDKKDEADPKKVFYRDCQDWVKDQVPIQPGRTRKYDMLPARIMRNMEILLGQKLYEDIYSVPEFIPKEEDFGDQREKLINKFHLDKDKLLVTISPGASVKGKEYTPERWEALISAICDSRPDLQILFIDDLDEEKKFTYGEMVDSLKQNKNYDIRRGSIALNEMNTLMHMSSVSVTPDSGIGHYSSMCGTPNVMISLSNPVFWSGPNTVRVIHPYGREMMRNNALTDLSPKNAADSYYYGDPENKRGASDISPEQLAERILRVLS